MFKYEFHLNNNLFCLNIHQELYKNIQKRQNENLTLNMQLYTELEMQCCKIMSIWLSLFPAWSLSMQLYSELEMQCRKVMPLWLSCFHLDLLTCSYIQIEKCSDIKSCPYGYLSFQLGLLTCSFTQMQRHNIKSIGYLGFHLGLLRLRLRDDLNFSLIGASLAFCLILDRSNAECAKQAQMKEHS